MSNCQPIIDANFLHMVTGVDISDIERIDNLISLVSDLIAAEMGGVCQDPDNCDIRVKVVCAQYVAHVLDASDDGSGSIKAETIGDYRVEYRPGASDGFDLPMLRRMLSPVLGRAYSTTTWNVERSSYWPYDDNGRVWRKQVVNR